jgi:hypothetical protein
LPVIVQSFLCRQFGMHVIRFAVPWHGSRNCEFGSVMLFAELHVGVQSVTYNCHTVCRSLVFLELIVDRDRWRALVSTVMNVRVPKIRGIS